jgi:hypothetical protein
MNCINLGAASKALFSKNPPTAGGILAPPATAMNDISYVKLLFAT